MPGAGADDPSTVVRPGTSRSDSSLIPPPTAKRMVPPSREAFASAPLTEPAPESASVVTVNVGRPEPPVVLKPNPGYVSPVARDGVAAGLRLPLVTEHAGAAKSTRATSATIARPKRGRRSLTTP